MGEHTPGPWFVREADDDQRRRAGSIRVDCQGGEAVTKVWGFNDEALANARLIATAPELLERVRSSNVALEEAANLLEGHGLAGCARIMRGYIDGNNAAIAKATGHD